MSAIRMGPYVLLVSFDCYGDIEEITDSRTGDDVTQYFNDATLALIESTARVAAIKQHEDGKADALIAEMDEQ